MEAPLGAALQSIDAALASVNEAERAVFRLTDAELVESCRRVAGLSSAVAALRASVIAEIADRGLPAQAGCRSTGRFLAQLLHESSPAGGQLVTEAEQHLAVPAVAEAMRTGRLGARSAAVAGRELSRISAMPEVDEETYQQAEELALELARSLDPISLAKALAHLRETLTKQPDEDDEQERRRVLEQERAVLSTRWLHINTATGSVRGKLTPIAAQALSAALDALAAQQDLPLPPEVLALAAKHGALVWCDHEEDCPQDADGCDADLPAATGWETEGDEQAHPDEPTDAHEQARPHEQTDPDEPTDPDAQDDRNRAELPSRFVSGCHCPWRIEWVHDAAPEGWPTPTTAESGHSQSGHSGLGTPTWKRSRTQSLADALGDLAHRALTTRSLPAQDAASPHLMLLATPDQLDGPLPQGQWSDGTPATPAEVATILCDAVVTPIIVDTRGRPLAVGREQKMWPRWLRRAVAARDRGCAFPGCSTNIRLCHVHHMRHFADGGPTDIDNGCLICPFHHYLVHNQGWTVRLDQANGRPAFVPPEWVDPEQRPRQHLRYLLLDPLSRTKRKRSEGVSRGPGQGVSRGLGEGVSRAVGPGLGRGISRTSATAANPAPEARRSPTSRSESGRAPEQSSERRDPRRSAYRLPTLFRPQRRHASRRPRRPSSSPSFESEGPPPF